MSESQPCGPDSLDARLATLANAAAILAWPLPRERDEATCCDLARVIDALLVRVARGRGALDMALGEALEVLATGNRDSCLGYSGIGDYTPGSDSGSRRARRRRWCGSHGSCGSVPCFGPRCERAKSRCAPRRPCCRRRGATTRPHGSSGRA